MDTKQVIVIRSDLKMRRGKEIAQGAHAAMEWIRVGLTGEIGGDTFLLSPAQREWIFSSFAKICVRVKSEEDLRDVHERARKAGLEAHLIIDLGKTEFAGIPTVTACAIGPDYSDKIDAVTGNLELY